jgi:hypothetical protein
VNEEIEKVKKRVEKRLELTAGNDNTKVPFNDVIDHMRQVEGYPSKNLSKVDLDRLPLLIRILGYLLVGSMGLGVLLILILMVIK